MTTNVDTGDRDLLVKCVTGLVALDLIGVVLVRLFLGEVPVVLGDVAKVGIGGLVMAGGLNRGRAS